MSIIVQGFLGSVVVLQGYIPSRNTGPVRQFKFNYSLRTPLAFVWSAP